MRTILLPAIVAVLLSGCTQTPRDLLTGGTWTCVAKDETVMQLTFAKDGTLSGKMKMADPTVPPPPDAITLSFTFGGSWTLAGDADLTFGFKDVKVAEAKRGSQDLEPAEAEYFRRGIETTTEVRSKIPSISSSKLVIAPDNKNEPLTCTR